MPSYIHKLFRIMTMFLKSEQNDTYQPYVEKPRSRSRQDSSHSNVDVESKLCIFMYLC